jgi:DNA helicase-4
LTADHYVARSEYLNEFFNYKKVIEKFVVLKNSGMLNEFCKKNNFDTSRASLILERYNSLQDNIDSQNERFVTSEMIRKRLP